VTPLSVNRYPQYIAAGGRVRGAEEGGSCDSQPVGTLGARKHFGLMAKYPTNPKPVEPAESPQPDPQPYKDPVKEPPFDPPDERPLIDPQPPDADKPRM
jgi:hypothetical protein